MRCIKILRFAALLHDIGHLPFSHAVEKSWLNNLKHDHLSQYIIEKYAPIRTVLEDEGIKPKEVSSLLTKMPPSRLRLLHEIVSGQLDADRADYLLRDAHFCGAKYGEYDFTRFLQIFSAKEDEEYGNLTIFVDESDLHVAESLLIARYHYNLQIPYHRTRMGYDIVLGRFIRDFPEYRNLFTVSNGSFDNVDIDRLIDLDDCEIIERIKKEKYNKNPWAPYLLREQHLIPIVDTSSNSPQGAKLYKKFVIELRSQKKFVEDDDFFTKDQTVEIIKGSKGSSEQTDENGSTDQYNPNAIMLRSQEGKGRQEEYVDIRHRSWIFGQFADEAPTLYRVYITPSKIEQSRDLLVKIER